MGETPVTFVIRAITKIFSILLLSLFPLCVCVCV
jgi:hypothetical protein